MNATPDLHRIRVVLRGAVQGVGFRPFVSRLARELGLTGFVSNSPAGVCVEAEGSTTRLREFLTRVQQEKPPRSSIQGVETWWLDAFGYQEFQIGASTSTGTTNPVVMADIATCDDCLRELFDPADRRFAYPFINCTQCGPRFSIIEALPYDRANTSMKRFTMCPECLAEYEDPGHRRFHAQPNACPVCGPHLEFWDVSGKPLCRGGNTETQPMCAAVAAIRDGQIVAVKGIGGFHLMADATNDRAVEALRIRKHREEKPIAVMFPSMAMLRLACDVSPTEEQLLRAPEAPIVLVRKRPVGTLSLSLSHLVAPENPYLGVFLPYTPLHHLLLSSLQVPVVATSGNLTEEPICIEEKEAVVRLQGIADFFLIHNRPIVRHVDDSVMRVVAGREMMLRRARGFAPLPIQLKSVSPTEAQADQGTSGRDENTSSALPVETVLGLGAQLKSAVALAIGSQACISQHIGDLATPEALRAYERVIADLQSLYENAATKVITDEHPDYLSTRFARSTSLPVGAIQHHVAHVLACMAENELAPPVFGIAWDGTGYGLDGTVWGGEFFVITDKGFQRVAHLRTFRLPGGEQAVREPRRSALGVLFELFGNAGLVLPDSPTTAAFSVDELRIMGPMLANGIQSPFTSSAGRLFDAAASLLGLKQRCHFEGQSAMALEFIAEENSEDGAYEFDLDARPEPWVIDWGAAMRAFLADKQQGLPSPAIALKFHRGLASCVTKVARRVGLERVVLSGGCFQNRLLTELSIESLRNSGFRPYWHQRVPPNDGGICLGQVVAAKWWNL